MVLCGTGEGLLKPMDPSGGSEAPGDDVFLRHFDKVVIAVSGGTGRFEFLDWPTSLSAQILKE